MQKCADSVILKLARCPHVNPVTKLPDVQTHYGEHQHLWRLHEGTKARDAERLTDCQGHALNKIPVMRSARGKKWRAAKAFEQSKPVYSKG